MAKARRLRTAHLEGHLRKNPYILRALSRSSTGGEIENPEFKNKRQELLRTRQVLEEGSVFRGKQRRKLGIGPQDVNYESTALIPAQPLFQFDKDSD
jgi:hypothetical protein